MTNLQKFELWRELNATDESYVREKYAIGGYKPCQRPVVAEWLAERDRLYDRQQQEIQNTAAQRLAFWTIVSACAALTAPVAAILLSFGT